METFSLVQSLDHKECIGTNTTEELVITVENTRGTQSSRTHCTMLD